MNYNTTLIVAAVAVAAFAAVLAIGNAFPILGSAYADSSSKLKVGCKDLALALITWDQLYPLVDDDNIAENEHILNDEGINPDTYTAIIDHHLNDLLDDFEDAKCNHLGNDIKDYIDDRVDFKR